MMNGKFVKRVYFLLVIMMVLSLVNVYAGGGGQAQSSGSAAANYPNKPIRLITSSGLGGGTDRLSRVLAAFSNKYLGVEMTVEPMPGGAATLGHTYIMGQPADGYTLLINGSSGTTITPQWQQVAFDPIKDHLSVARLASEQAVIIVPNNSPINTFEEFLSYCRANPGTKIAVSGVNGVDDFQVHLMNQKLSTNLIPVSYDSGGEVVLAVMGGEAIGAVTSSPSAKSQTDAGLLKVVVYLSEEPDANFPTVPSVAQLGYPEVAFNNSLGIAVRAGTDPAIVKKLEDFLLALPNDPEYVQAMVNAGHKIAPLNSVEYTKFLESTIATVKQVVATIKK